MQTMQECAQAEGEIRIFTHLHHREDTMALYGFSKQEEREIFLELIKISGIGPKQALRILSGLPPQQFVQAIENEEMARLSQIPGIGKKTAGKIILALRGKIMSEKNEEADAKYADLETALIDMGFDRKKSRQALQELAKELDSATLSGSEYESELFRKAIIHLSSQK